MGPAHRVVGPDRPHNGQSGSLHGIQRLRAGPHGRIGRNDCIQPIRPSDDVLDLLEHPARRRQSPLRIRMRPFGEGPHPLGHRERGSSGDAEHPGRALRLAPLQNPVRRQVLVMHEQPDPPLGHVPLRVRRPPGRRIGRRLQWLRVRCQPFRHAETLVGVSADVPWPREVVLATRLDPRDPPPGQSVHPRIAIEQMPDEEVRPQLPGQLQREHPDRGEPHARVVVHVAVADDLMRPVVEVLDPRLAPARRLPARAQTLLGRHAVESALQPRAIRLPDCWPQLHPTLEVRAPEYLRDGLLGVGA